MNVVKLAGFVLAILLTTSCASRTGSAEGKARSKPPRNSTVSTATGWTYENENFTGANGYASSGFAAHENYRPQIPAGMVVVEGGTFMMGEKTDMMTAQRNNLTRRVSVGSFYMDQYEVSNLNWREYVHWMEVVFGATAPRRHGAWVDHGRRRHGGAWRRGLALVPECRSELRLRLADGGAPDLLRHAARAARPYR